MTWWAPRPARAEEAWQEFAAVMAWLLGLQLLDLLTTLGALAHGAAEANPVAAALLATGGPAALAQLKVAAIVAGLGWLGAFGLLRRGGASATLDSLFLTPMVVLMLFYSVVVVNNLAVLAAQVHV